MRSFLNILILIFSFHSQAQNDSLRWDEKWNYSISKDAVWRVNSLGNLIIGHKAELRKIDSLGNLNYTQSSKNLGTLSKIDPRNTMKTLLFSSDQQIIGFIDNTLTKQQNVVDLSEYDFSYVSLVCASNLSDRFWVFDQDNSKIALVTTQKSQNQRIENLSGLLGIYNLIDMFEHDNKLYLVDSKKGLFLFDNFGTFVRYWDFENLISVDIQGDYAFLLKKEGLFVLNFLNDQVTQINLPLSGVFQFQKVGEFFYFQTEKGIFKYKFEIIEK
jgi:hypothetical protein